MACRGLLGPQAMRRRPDWPERLAALVESHTETPFAWGTHDCVCWVASATEAMTGVDPWAAKRGTYSTEAEADDIVAEAGGLEALAASLAGDGAEVPPARARRGDWLLAEVGNEVLLSVCLGERLAALGLDGLRLLPVGRLGVRVLRAWRV